MIIIYLLFTFSLKGALMLDRHDVASLKNCVNSVIYAYTSLAEEIIKNHPEVNYPSFKVKAHLLQQSFEDLYRVASNSTEAAGYLREFFDENDAFGRCYAAYQAFKQEKAIYYRPAPPEAEKEVWGFLALCEARYVQIMKL